MADWIKGAIAHPGAFTKKAEKAGSGVAAFAKKEQHAPGKTGKQARLALTLKKMHSGGDKTDKKALKGTRRG